MIDVGCAGILVADTICGPMTSIPAAGQLLVIEDIKSTVGGCAANVASGLAKQEIAVGVSGCVGNDHGAKIVLGELQTRGVDCSQVKPVEELATSQTSILLVKGEDRRFIHVFGANRAFAVELVDREWVAGLKAFYVGGLFAMPNFHCEQLAELLRFCQSRGVLTVVDVVAPQGMDDFGDLQRCLPYIDYFLPNDDEAEQITGQANPVDQARSFRDMGVGTTIITLGDQGAIALQGNKLWRADVFEFDLVDPTGCGDAFDAGLITAALRGGMDVPEILSYASALGGSCARAVGAHDGVFSAAEAEEFLRTNRLKIAFSEI